MKCYTMASPGIKVSGGRVILGEEGRGREISYVPVIGIVVCPNWGESKWLRYTSEPAPSRCEICGEEWTVDGDYARHPQAGKTDAAKGGTIFYARVGLDADGRPVIKAEESGDEERILILLCASGGHRGGVNYSLPEGTKQLESGYHAQGIAGRMGGWSESLAVVPTGTEIKYRTWGGGGHIGGTRWLRIADDGSIVEEDEAERKERLAREAAERGEVQWL